MFKPENEREWVVGDNRVERMAHFYTKYYNSFVDARRKHWYKKLTSITQKRHTQLIKLEMCMLKQ
jgi:hypothetical protein